MNLPYVINLKESQHMISTWRFYNFKIVKTPCVTKGVMGSLVAWCIRLFIFKVALEAYYSTWYPWLNCFN